MEMVEEILDTGRAGGSVVQKRYVKNHSNSPLPPVKSKRYMMIGPILGKVCGSFR